MPLAVLIVAELQAIVHMRLVAPRIRTYITAGTVVKLKLKQITAEALWAKTGLIRIFLITITPEQSVEKNALEASWVGTTIRMLTIAITLEQLVVKPNSVVLREVVLGDRMVFIIVIMLEV